MVVFLNPEWNQSKLDVVDREVRHIFVSLRIVSRFVNPMIMNVSRETLNLDGV